MIRKPVPADMPQILGLARRFHAESYFRRIRVNERKIINLIAASTQPDAMVFTRVSDTAGVLNGIVMGYLDQYWFSDEVGAFDLWMFVVPERRRALVAVRLWQAFRDWAKERGAIDLTNGVSSGVNIENAQKFFTRLGMEHVGGLYKLPFDSVPPSIPSDGTGLSQQANAAPLAACGTISK